MSYLTIKWLHVLSSTVLFGTGLGSAFYMFCASRTRDPRVIAVVSGHVVLADWIFTTPTVILQPASGLYMAHLAGFSFASPWLLWSIVLYFVAGAAWLPVIWMQIRMREMARRAVTANHALPPSYWKLLRGWTGLGIIAFTAMVAVFYLMVAKPA